MWNNLIKLIISFKVFTASEGERKAEALVFKKYREKLWNLEGKWFPIIRIKGEKGGNGG